MAAAKLGIPPGPRGKGKPGEKFRKGLDAAAAATASVDVGEGVLVDELPVLKG